MGSQRFQQIDSTKSAGVIDWTVNRQMMYESEGWDSACWDETAGLCNEPGTASSAGLGLVKTKRDRDRDRGPALF